MSEIRVNNITNRDGTAGPSIAGIPVVDSNSHFVVPTGRTGQRYADGGENIVRDGLVLHLDAKYSYPSKTGITTTTDSLDPDVYTWYDMSGNENHGELTSIDKTASAGPTYNSTNEGSLDFHGTNEQVHITSLSNKTFDRQITLDIWIASDYTSTDYNSFIMRTTNNAWNNGFGIHQYNGNLFWWINQWNGAWIVSTPKTSFGFTNIIATYNGYNLKLYDNGSLVATGSQYEQNIENPITPVVVGGAYTTPFYVIDGRVAIVRIYDKALTASEVSQNFEALRSRFGI